MSKTVLIVDDSASVRQMVHFSLRSAGYGVLEAADGRVALAMFTTPIHLVISDLNMPNMDGISLVKALRAGAATKYVPVVMLTTESQETKKQEARAAGATGWIVKPFKAEQLVAVVKRVLG